MGGDGAAGEGVVAEPMAEHRLEPTEGNQVLGGARVAGTGGGEAHQGPCGAAGDRLRRRQSALAATLEACDPGQLMLGRPDRGQAQIP